MARLAGSRLIYSYPALQYCPRTGSPGNRFPCSKSATCRVWKTVYLLDLPVCSHKDYKHTEEKAAILKRTRKAFCASTGHCSALVGMAENGAKQPLLTGAPDVMLNANKMGEPKKRRFRRCKSAPLAEFVPRELNGTDASPSPPRPKSILDNVHPSIKKVSIFLFLYLTLGTICFYLVRNQISGKKTSGVLDSVYFCIVTMTTVGYGDLVPNSAATKLLACAFVFSGMALVGLVLSKGADYLVEKEEVLLVKAFNMHRKVGPTALLKEIETNKASYKCAIVFIIVLVQLVVGTIFLATVENLSIVDAFYCVCSTVTTLGYGDKSFSTTAGRIFAIFWILSSTLCLAQFLLYIAEANTENRRKELVKWVLTRRMTNVDLEAADLDDDGQVGAAEFIIYKLKEMGKINQEDIAPLMEEFEDLDVDQSGTLSPSDLMLAQSSETKRESLKAVVEALCSGRM